MTLPASLEPSGRAFEVVGDGDPRDMVVTLPSGSATEPGLQGDWGSHYSPEFLGSNRWFDRFPARAGVAVLWGRWAARKVGVCSTRRDPWSSPRGASRLRRPPSRAPRRGTTAGRAHGAKFLAPGERVGVISCDARHRPPAGLFVVALVVAVITRALQAREHREAWELLPRIKRAFQAFPGSGGPQG